LSFLPTLASSPCLDIVRIGKALYIKKTRFICIKNIFLSYPLHIECNRFPYWAVSPVRLLKWMMWRFN
jgi:hypothetical protein